MALNSRGVFLNVFKVVFLSQQMNTCAVVVFFFWLFYFGNHVVEIYEQVLGVVSGKSDWLYNSPRLHLNESFLKRFNIDLWQREMNLT